VEQFNLKKVWLVMISLLLITAAVSARESGSRWLLIDTDKLLLKVMSGERVEAVFRNISIGRNGAGIDKKSGDEKTPLGEFRIGWINRNSHYRLFFGFTYPSLAIAREGLANGTIDREMYAEIRAAVKMNKIPPQNSALGGQFGIHGLGDADPEIHHKMNWTKGCIALTNEQIDSLNHWIIKGMRVVVI